MRTLISHVLMWALERVLPAHGRHSDTDGPRPPEPWERAWTTPVPRHVTERHTPLRGEDTHLVRPYAPLDDTLRLRIRRKRALLYAPHGLALPGVRP
ncbi:hypothetical protein ACWEFL_29395 [Streptomyces sp. NPDC004838]